MQRAGQNQILDRWSPTGGMNDRHGGNGENFGVVGESFVLRAALEHQQCANDHQNNDDEEENQKKRTLLLTGSAGIRLSRCVAWSVMFSCSEFHIAV